MKKILQYVLVLGMIVPTMGIAQQSPTYPMPIQPTSCTTVCTATYCTTVCN